MNGCIVHGAVYYRYRTALAPAGTEPRVPVPVVRLVYTIVAQSQQLSRPSASNPRAERTSRAAGTPQPAGY